MVASFCYFKTLFKEPSISPPLLLFMYLNRKSSVRKLITVFWIAQSVGIYDHKWVLLKTERKEIPPSNDHSVSPLGIHALWEFNNFLFIYLFVCLLILSVIEQTVLYAISEDLEKKKPCVLFAEVTVGERRLVAEQCYDVLVWVDTVVPLCGLIQSPGPRGASCQGMCWSPGG